MRYGKLYNIATKRITKWYRVDWICIPPPKLKQKIWIMLKNGYIPYKYWVGEDY